MMQTLFVFLLGSTEALAAAVPALAQEGDPLAESVLLPNMVGWALAGLAVLLVVLFLLWSRRNPG